MFTEKRKKMMETLQSHKNHTALFPFQALAPDRFQSPSAETDLARA